MGVGGRLGNRICNQLIYDEKVRGGVEPCFIQLGRSRLATPVGEAPVFVATNTTSHVLVTHMYLQKVVFVEGKNGFSDGTMDRAIVRKCYVTKR